MTKAPIVAVFGSQHVGPIFFRKQIAPQLDTVLLTAPNSLFLLRDENSFDRMALAHLLAIRVKHSRITLFVTRDKRDEYSDIGPLRVNSGSETTLERDSLMALTATHAFVALPSIDDNLLSTLYPLLIVQHATYAGTGNDNDDESSESHENNIAPAKCLHADRITAVVETFSEQAPDQLHRAIGMLREMWYADEPVDESAVRTLCSALAQKNRAAKEEQQ